MNMKTGTRWMKTILLAMAGLALVGCGRDSAEPDQSASVQLTGDSEQDKQIVEMADWIAWRCGEIPVDVQIAADDKLVLALPWQDHVLQAEQAARGARYGGEGVQFWSSGHHSARLSLEGQPDVDCRPAGDISPWTAARERGIDFRASGNEPGWLMEFRNGDPARLRLLLDYGTHELTFEDITVLPDQAGFTADAPGNHVEIELIHEPCHDTMVDWTFPVRVEMTLNDLNLSACGRFFGVPLP